MSLPSDVIKHADALFVASNRKPGAEQFITVLLGGRYGTSVEAHTDIDRAAEDAHDHDALGRYFGTLHIAADGSLQWLDLRDRAHELHAIEDASFEADRQFLESL